MSYSQMPYAQSYAESHSNGLQRVVSFENAIPSNNRATLNHGVRAVVSDTLSTNVFEEAEGLPAPTASATVFNMGALAAGYAACAAAEPNHHSLSAASAYNQSYFCGFHPPTYEAENSNSFCRNLIASSNFYGLNDTRTDFANSAIDSTISYSLYNPASSWPDNIQNVSAYATVESTSQVGSAAATRRKNATRENSSTLKSWLNDHLKNPYPTKGEKIMLAIITKMTLTQVSTWFANARRRLKKENKMTWAPHYRSDNEEDAYSQDTDVDSSQLKESNLDNLKENSIQRTSNKQSPHDSLCKEKSNDLPSRVASPIPSMINPVETRVITRTNYFDGCSLEKNLVDNCRLKASSVCSLARTVELTPIDKETAALNTITEKAVGVLNKPMTSPTISWQPSICHLTNLSSSNTIQSKQSHSQNLTSISPSHDFQQQHFSFTSNNVPLQNASCLPMTFDLDCASVRQLSTFSNP